MAIKLAEQTNGPHIFMRLRLDSGRVEEIDAYTTEKGWRYAAKTPSRSGTKFVWSSRNTALSTRHTAGRWQSS